MNSIHRIFPHTLGALVRYSHQDGAIADWEVSKRGRRVFT